MNDSKQQEQILRQYIDESEEILQEMRRIVLRAQRKVDDESYRKALENIEKLK